MRIEVKEKNMRFLECLSSSTRVNIIERLGQQPMNITALSEVLYIRPSIITRHIQMLEEAGIVRSELRAGKRGMQKLCFLHIAQATLLFDSPTDQG